MRTQTKGKLDSITETQLYNLAYQNAIQGGTGVYMARAMLGIDVEDAFNVARLAQTDNTETPYSTHFILFPNPSTGMYFMECMLEEDANGMFIVRDVLGKVIYSNKLFNGFNNVHFNLKEHKSGIYYYELIVNKVTEKAGKLSLIK